MGCKVRLLPLKRYLQGRKDAFHALLQRKAVVLVSVKE